MAKRKTNRRNSRRNRRNTRRNRRNTRRNRRRGGAEERPTFKFRVKLIKPINYNNINNNMNINNNNNNNNNNNDDDELDGGDYSADVIAWYYANQGDTEEFFQMQDINLRYDPEERVFIGSYRPTNGFDPAVSINMYVDMDDDGNHLIEINGTEYNVMGFLV